MNSLRTKCIYKGTAANNTKGNKALVVATHVDKVHIHILNTTSLDCIKKINLYKDRI